MRTVGVTDDQQGGDAAQELDLAELERRIGHVFADRSLLLRAVTHRSFAHESTEGPCEDNEALEFLGDAVLSFLVADILYGAFPGLDEGRLSKHKSLLENLRTLAQVAGELGLGPFLRLGRGETLSGGARNEKILSDALEAVVAAVYLDGGLPSVSTLVRRLLASRLEQVDGQNPVADYKSALQEQTQSRGRGTPLYRVLSESGPDHQKQFCVVVSLDGLDLAEGEGSTKRAAHQVAAQRALERLLAAEPPHPG